MSGPPMNSPRKESFAAGATNSTDVADCSDSQLADTATYASSSHPDFGFTNGLSSEMESLFGKEVDTVAHLEEDVQPDAELTKCVVARRMLLVESKCPQWPDFIRRVALGVLLMSTARDINMQEMVHFSTCRRETSTSDLTKDRRFYTITGRSGSSTVSCQSL